MADTFKAIVAVEQDGKSAGSLTEISTDDLPDHDVLVDVDYSSLNYKDGLAVSGVGRICRSLPMVCGIDLAGTVAESASPDFAVGDPVLVNGYGLSESHWGGYSQRARVKSEWLVRRPDGFTAKQAMAIGTAGYTAMLCVLALEDHGVQPESGEVLVTGAAGGVGSVAIALLAKLGYQVVASSGRAETHDYLRGLGAGEIIDRQDLSGDPKPIGRERWAGVVDSVGANTLANAISQIKYGGCAAACGLAGGINLPTSVFPFILRGVVLAGIDSVMAPMEKRVRAWSRLAQDLSVDKLDEMTTVEPLSAVPDLAQAILKGQTRGRVVIDVNA